MTGAIASGARHEVRVEGITSEGAGVGRLPDGRVVFVHRTAPGDRARIEVTRVTPRWARGRLVDLVQAGPDRRPPPCPHYERCGGCTLEHLTYPAQLRTKERIARDALERIGERTDLPPTPVRPSPRELRYRNRVSFTLRRDGGDRVVAGFHALEAPGEILDVDGRCLLPEEAVARAWDGLRDGWGSGARRLPAGRELRLTLQGTERGEVVLLVEGGEGPGDPEALLAAVPELRAVWGRRADPRGEPELFAGEVEVLDRVGGERIRVRPGAFLQVNRSAAARLRDHVLGLAGEPEERRAVDAYCGVGGYGRALARSGWECVGIERDAGAASAARSRPRPGFRLLEGRVEDRLEEALPAALVLLNPPRTGVASGVMERLNAAGTERIVYVSCDPATLARDLRRLGPHYRIRSSAAFDLFPQTAHVEVVLTLARD